MPTPASILARKRDGESLSDEEILSLVAGVTNGDWSDAQVGAFLMAAVIRGLDLRETETLTRAMLESGERWNLRSDVPAVGDKHSTGGVGDKVSIVLCPLLAACGQPVAMLTGRGLGHTGGTADKLETIPGLELALTRERTLGLLEKVGVASGIATAAVAPADRRLYALRDVTATIESLPLITASILSKKLATGAAGVVFDVKTGDAAFLPDLAEARRLAGLLVATSKALGTPARAVLTDMSQPLGRWAGHAAEIAECLACLEGHGPADLMDVTYVLAEELTELLGRPLDRGVLAGAISSGRARESFDRWAAAQGADPRWLANPTHSLAPVEVQVLAPRAGVLAKVANRRLGTLLGEAGGGRRKPGDPIDPGISLHVRARLGEVVEAGDELARVYLRRPDDAMAAHFRACFEVGESGAAPALIGERLL